MRNFILLSFIFMVVGLSACFDGQTPSHTTKYLSVNGDGMVDSSLIFTFDGDSILYVDDYKSGCGLESYSIEVEHKDEHETLYKANKFVLECDETDSVRIHHIKLFKLSINHWVDTYILFIGDSVFSSSPYKELIPIIRIEPNKTKEDT